MTYLNKFANIDLILIAIYCFVDDFIKGIVNSIQYALKKPDHVTPPAKQYHLSIAELVSLALFRFFTGHRNWKQFYKFIKTYHASDFPNIANYQNFLSAMNKLSLFAVLFLQALMNFFKSITGLNVFQLQQLGLPLVWRSKVEWWLEYLSSNHYEKHIATSYKNLTSEHPGGTYCNEKANT